MPGPSVSSTYKTQSDAIDQCNHTWPTITLPLYLFTGQVSEDFAEHFAADMSLVHNVLIRSLNSLWHHAPLILPNDVVAYANYGLAAIAAIHLHHGGEEQVIFPALKNAGLHEMVEGNLEQHDVFHAALDVLEVFLKGVVDGKVFYDPERMRKLLKDLADPLVAHLHEEITTIQPETMRKVDKVVLTKIN